MQHEINKLAKRESVASGVGILLVLAVALIGIYARQKSLVIAPQLAEKKKDE